MKLRYVLATAAAAIVAASSPAVTAIPASAAPTALALAAQPAAVAAGAGNGPAAVEAAMSMPQRIGQLLMAGQPAAGPLSSQIGTDITTYHAGSVILTGRSSAGVSATARLTGQLQAEATSAATHGVPLFVATDQEGGNVQVLSGSGFSTIPTALSQGGEAPHTLDVNAAEWGAQLKAAGVNLNLAPVLDTVPANEASTNQPIGVFQREYGFTPAAVTTAGSAYIDGMHQAGTSVTIKHFPGLGRASGNTDTTFGVTDTVTTSNDAFLQPYSAAISTGAVPAVMVSEAIYTKIDPAHQAVFSTAVMESMLRSELGFHGMIMSDSMDATAVDNLTPGQRAVDFVNAGGDLVLATNPADIPAMYDALAAQAQASASFATKITDAAKLVLVAKQQSGLLGGIPGASATASQNNVLERAAGNGIVEFNQSDGAWSGPVSLGGQAGTQPAATAVPGTTTNYAAVTGLNGEVYMLTLAGDQRAGGWTATGSATATAPPGLGAAPDGQITLAYRDHNDTIWVRSFNPAAGGGAWTHLGGKAIDAPIGVAYAPSGDLYVFVTGANLAVYVNTRHDGTWSGFQPLTGITTASGPSAVTVPGGPVEVFVQGPGGVPYERTNTGGTFSPSWTSLGGNLASPPSAGSGSSGSSFVVGVGDNGSMYQDINTNGTWSGWKVLPID